jgi:hypothetical protein
MADSNQLGVSPISFKAGAAIGINRAVILDSASNTVIAASAITDLVIGIALEAAAAAGDLVPVQVFGKAKVVASAAIAVGAQLMPTGSGSGKVATAAGATAKSMGVALQAAGADGDVIEALLACPNVNGVVNT